MADTTAPAAKRRKLNFTETVQVLVGEPEQAFTLHKDVLCNHSTIFREALEHNKEAHDCTIRLPDINNDSFRAYVQWAYSGEIVVMDPEEVAQDLIGRRQRTALMMLHITGGRLGDTLLRNRTIDNIIALNKATATGFGPWQVRLAWAHLDEISMLRKLIVEDFKWRPSASWLRDHRLSVPTSFFVDLAISMADSMGERNTNLRSEFLPNCTLHDHDADVPRCADP